MRVNNPDRSPFTIRPSIAWKRLAGRSYGRGAGVGRGLGVGVHLPVHGVGVGVGVGAQDCAQFLPPVFV